MHRLMRVFHIDIELYAGCGGTLRVTGCIATPDVIERTLTHLVDREADFIHNPRTPPLSAPAAELPDSTH